MVLYRFEMSMVMPKMKSWCRLVWNGPKIEWALSIMGRSVGFAGEDLRHSSYLAVR
jgi:hypothetical protein